MSSSNSTTDLRLRKVQNKMANIQRIPFPRATPTFWGSRARRAGSAAVRPPWAARARRAVAAGRTRSTCCARAASCSKGRTSPGPGPARCARWGPRGCRRGCPGATPCARTVRGGTVTRTAPATQGRAAGLESPWSTVRRVRQRRGYDGSKPCFHGRK